MDLTGYEQKYIQDMAKGSSMYAYGNAGIEVIDLLVDGVLDFRDMWKGMTNRKLRSNLAPVILVNKQKLAKLCDLLPISTELVTKPFSVSWIDLIYSYRKNKFVRVYAPTMYIVDSRENFVNMIGEDLIKGIDDRYEVTPLGKTIDAAVDMFLMMTAQWGLFRSFVNYIKKRSIQNALLEKLLQKGYIKAK